jgi:NAD-dependent SIR2 family protein deacetylase
MPPHEPPLERPREQPRDNLLTSSQQAAVRQLAELWSANKPALILTGAGISTDSGIPAYRDENGQWIHSKPVQAAEFYNHESVRKRYWLRSMLGWSRIGTAEPNATHHAITQLQRDGLGQCIVTQNVDNLHHRANNKHVIDLHGNLQSVVCLQCHATTPRHHVQERLQHLNPDVIGRINDNAAAIRPDGDAAPANLEQLLTDFTVANCPSCGGVLKPDVVFFGENVPTERVEYCMEQLQRSSLLVCIGTSLTVFSGFRFCRAASRQGIPVALINRGRTRADELATCAVDANCADALQQLTKLLS